MRSVLFLLLLIAVVGAGCQELGQKASAQTSQITGQVTAAYLSTERDSVNQIASMDRLGELNLDKFEDYQNFADNTNAMLRVLNEKMGWNLPGFDRTRAGYEKFSKTVTEYTPLVNSYDSVVLSARLAQDGTPEHLDYFRQRVTVFGLEAGLVATAAFYSASYSAVGTVYFGTGLNRMALTCASCVSVALGEAHWFIRTFLVESAGHVAEAAFELSKIKVNLPEIEFHPDISGWYAQGQTAANQLLEKVRTN